MAEKLLLHAPHCVVVNIYIVGIRFIIDNSIDNTRTRNHNGTGTRSPRDCHRIDTPNNSTSGHRSRHLTCTHHVSCKIHRHANNNATLRIIILSLFFHRFVGPHFLSHLTKLRQETVIVVHQAALRAMTGRSRLNQTGCVTLQPPCMTPEGLEVQKSGTYYQQHTHRRGTKSLLKEIVGNIDRVSPRAHNRLG